MSHSSEPIVVHAATIEIDERAIEDLRRRIQAVRLPDVPLDGRGAYGSGSEVVHEILQRWARFDVHRLLRDLNSIPQVSVTVDGLRLRAFHLRGERDDALPIVITHGWPSTVLEPLNVADRLARPSSYGGDPRDCFHVVVPAMPGFPLSAAPTALNDYTAARIADRWMKLMTALGYDRFVASASDIGARVTTWLASRHPHHVRGIHVSSNALDTSSPGTEHTAAEEAWLGRRATWDWQEGGYMHLQQTKPLSLAHGLADSPAGLAAWIGEKWHGWSDRFQPDVLLGHLSLYWLTNSIATSLIHYYAYDLPPGPRPPANSIDVPVSFVLSPAENGGIPPRSLAERQFPVARWTELPRGGHFLASEEPDLLAKDLRDAFRPLRS